MSALTVDLWQEFRAALHQPAVAEPVSAPAAAVTALPIEAQELGLLLYVMSVVLPAADIL